MGRIRRRRILWVATPSGWAAAQVEVEGYAVLDGAPGQPQTGGRIAIELEALHVRPIVGSTRRIDLERVPS